MNIHPLYIISFLQNTEYVYFKIFPIALSRILSRMLLKAAVCIEFKNWALLP